MASVPLAVAPSNPTPGLYLTVDLLRGAASPGQSKLKCLIVGPKMASGDMTADTEVREVYSPEDVATACGSGSLPHLAYQAAIKKDPTISCSILCPTASAGSVAAGAITFTGVPTTSGTVRLWVQGRVIDVPWLAGDAVTDIKARAVAAINKLSPSLYVTASSGSAGAVTMTAKGAGPAGNDIKIRYKILDGCAGGAVTITAMSGGTTEPDFTTALATVQGTEYDYIALCCSNADVNAASSNNPARLQTHIAAVRSGLNAKLQQGIIGTTCTSVSTAKVGAIGRNAELLEEMLGMSIESLPCEVSGAEMGSRSNDRKLRGNANRIGTDMSDVLYGSPDVIGDQPTAAESTDALSNGVSLLSYTAQGQIQVMRAITTHSADTSGNQDFRCFDCNEIDAMFDYAKDLRSALPLEFPQCKIARDRVPGDEELPTGVVEERDVKAFIVSRTQYWIRNGYINGEAFNASVAAGELIVQVNETDETQLDIFIPAKPFKVLAKFGLFLAKKN